MDEVSWVLIWYLEVLVCELTGYFGYYATQDETLMGS